MLQYNYPTIIQFGNDALNAIAPALQSWSSQKLCIVTDKNLVQQGLCQEIIEILERKKIPFVIFDSTHPNPIEEDVEKALELYQSSKCDSILALGGGSPIDVAKTLRIVASHPGPLEQYDDNLQGSEKIIETLPPMIAIPTTAGTGSEVGRSSVVLMRKTGVKTIFFHPKLIPNLAILCPKLTQGLPPHLTAATGLDAFTHCLEAFLVPSLHPMADGIALESLRLIIEYLPKAYHNGKDLEARGRMLLASQMGATAFQKGLGMTHSLAHPLSAQFSMHHGLANAILLPHVLRWLETHCQQASDRSAFQRVQDIFKVFGLAEATLSSSVYKFVQSLGIEPKLSVQGINKENLDSLSPAAFADGCHQNNRVAVTMADLRQVYEWAL